MTYTMFPPSDRPAVEIQLRMQWKTAGCTCTPDIEWPPIWPLPPGSYSDILVVHDDDCVALTR